MKEEKEKTLEEREKEMKERHVRDDEIVHKLTVILIPVMIIGSIIAIIWGLLL